ncbi:hypothetical protein N7493_000115 [Penicillium malachiteum]|uniref:Uncharacterized protein n=1 Tax=Penicillium malachiteum TaxID=1324776 RepID=A0AAD6HVP4_9EURO|nr:hypothetical protein N7493_000115 [Penicillium malachiteum]
MSTMTTLERSHSSASLSMSSPRLSVRETTPPGAEPSLTRLQYRINQLDSQLFELRSTFLSEDSYVERRNREDSHVRREFANTSATCNRIDLNVVALRSTVEQIRSNVDSNAILYKNERDFLNSEFDRVEKRLNQLDELVRSDSSAWRIEISKLKTITNDIRTDMRLMETRINGRLSIIESRMKHADRVRFNSLAHTLHAPINPIPVILDDGTLQWPKWFPRTVWRFWCLKKRSRGEQGIITDKLLLRSNILSLILVHRLTELAEFYQLEGYQSWSRLQPSDFHSYDSDSSDSSDSNCSMTRAEAVHLFPEAAHQALAATLGLVYYKIRNEVGEGPHAVMAPRPPKRQQDEVASSTTSTKSKPVKIPRRPSVSDTFLQRLIHGPSIDTKSSTSEEFDQIGWKAFSEVSDDAKDKLRSIDPHDLGAVLRALEQGRLKLKPSRSEQQNASPTESKGANPFRHAPNPVPRDEPNPTEPLTASLCSERARRTSVSEVSISSNHNN